MKILISVYLVVLLVFSNKYQLDLTYNFQLIACDDLVSDNTNSLGYKSRDNRCEGFFISKVSSPSLDLVGITRGDFTWKSSEKYIRIPHPTVVDEAILIRAQGIPLRTYYRMDASIQSKQTFIWPITEIIDKAGLQPENIGLLGWIVRKNQLYYIPISTTDNQNQKNIVLTFRTTNDVTNMQWRYLDNNKQGQYTEWIKLKNNLFRAGEPIKIILPGSINGNNSIEVAARTNHRTTWLRQVFNLLND